MIQILISKKFDQCCADFRIPKNKKGPCFLWQEPSFPSQEVSLNEKS